MVNCNSKLSRYLGQELLWLVSKSMDGSFQLMLLIAYDFNYFFENKYLEIFNLLSASECWYTDNGLQCPEPSKCYHWRMQFNLVGELQSHRFSPDALVFKAEIYDKHILTRNYQTKSKFLPNYSSSNILHQVAINTAKFGLTKFFHQQNGDFVVISFGTFIQPIGYFWGYHDGQLYKFKVFEAKFSFKLAFDRNSLSYLELFNAYPFGAGTIQTDTGINIIKKFCERFLPQHVSQDFFHFLGSDPANLRDELYIEQRSPNFEYYEQQQLRGLSPRRGHFGHFSQSQHQQPPVTGSFNFLPCNPQ